MLIVKVANVFPMPFCSILLYIKTVIFPQVRHNKPVWRAMRDTISRGRRPILDRLLQLCPQPAHLRVFQPRLSRRVQKYPHVRSALLLQLLERHGNGAVCVVITEVRLKIAIV